MKMPVDPDSAGKVFEIRPFKNFSASGPYIPSRLRREVRLTDPELGICVRGFSVGFAAVELHLRHKEAPSRHTGSARDICPRLVTGQEAREVDFVEDGLGQ